MSHNAASLEKSFSPQDIETRVVLDFAELESLEEDWQRLWRQSRRLEIFTSFGWARAWWKTYGSNLKLCTPVAWIGQQVAGILPLVASGRSLRFLGSPIADYCDLLCVPGMEGPVLTSAQRSLLSLDAPWTRCDLHNLPEGSALLSGLAMLPSDLRRWTSLATGLASFALVLEHDKDSALAAILKKDRFKKDRKRLSKLGTITFVHLDDRKTVRQHLPAFVKQFQHRRAMAGEAKAAQNGPLLQFYEALLEELDPSKELRFSVLEVGGRALAYHLGFEVPGKFTYYKPTFDVDFWDYSPGAVLNAHLLEYVGKPGINEFDFSVGEEDYKSHFTNCVRWTTNLTFFRPAALSRISRTWFGVRHSSKWEFAKPLLRKMRRLLSRGANSMRGRGLSGTREFLPWLLRSALPHRDHILVFAKPWDGAASGECSLNSAGLVIDRGAFSAVGEFALQFPDVWHPSLLPVFRRRWKQGDRFYLARNGERIVYTTWVCTSNTVTIGERDELNLVKVTQPVPIIYDYWTNRPYEAQDTCCQMLHYLVSAEQKAESEIWICCPKASVVMREAIERSGFELRLESVDFRILPWRQPKKPRMVLSQASDKPAGTIKNDLNHRH